jgi:4-carboxymuconolactone decarboxylase
MTVGKTHRFPRVPIGEMNAVQQIVADRILSSSRMGGNTLQPHQSIPGPFNAWMQAPELGNVLEPVGDHIRFNTSLPARLSELVIILTARHWDSDYEWYMHRRIALSAGIRPEIADAIAEFARPEGMAEDEAAVHDFCAELHDLHKVGDANFQRLADLVGLQGVIEVIAISGYYSLVSMTLNVAQVPIPADAEPLPARL